mgnify:CR=1 FL=1
MRTYFGKNIDSNKERGASYDLNDSYITKIVSIKILSEGLFSYLEIFEWIQGKIWSWIFSWIWSNIEIQKKRGYQLQLLTKWAMKNNWEMKMKKKKKWKKRNLKNIELIDLMHFFLLSELKMRSICCGGCLSRGKVVSAAVR